MKLICKESKNTFNAKDGQERHYHNFYLVTDNGKYIQIKTAFVSDIDKLYLLGNTEIDFALVKKQSKDTYKNKSGKDCHFYNYYLKNQNGRLLQIRCCYDDYDKLDLLAVYEGNK